MDFYINTGLLAVILFAIMMACEVVGRTTENERAFKIGGIVMLIAAIAFAVLVVIVLTVTVVAYI